VELTLQRARTRKFGSLEYHGLKGKRGMQIETTKKLFTVDEYYRMAEAGIIGPEDRVELIDGEVIQMSAIGHRHMTAVNRSNDFLTGAFRRRAIVSVQNSLRLTNYTEPQPDIVLLKYRPDFYKEKKFTTDDALLVIEVADTTIGYDRQIKLHKYAQAMVREVWIANLEDDVLEVYRDPAAGRFNISLILRRGESVFVLAFPETPIPVDEILG
jgi:Uma2 family endonuclease